MKFFKRQTLPLLAVLLPSLVFNAYAENNDLNRIQERGKIAIGVTLSGLPYGTIDPSTSLPVGYNVTIADELAKELHVKPEIISVTAANRVQFLQQGKVDVLVAVMVYNKQRAKLADYVPTPYDQTGDNAIAPKSAHFKNWADIKGKTVCLSQGTNTIEPLTQLYGAKVKAFPGMAESLLALRGGNCDLAVHNRVNIQYLTKTNSDWNDFESPFHPDLLPSPSVMWVRKGEPALKQKINEIVLNWQKNGWLIEVNKDNGIEPTEALLRWHEEAKAGKPLSGLEY